MQAGRFRTGPVVRPLGQVNVETPVNLTKRQQELLREFEAEDKGRKTSPESEGFFNRVKEFWEDLTD